MFVFSVQFLSFDNFWIMKLNFNPKLTLPLSPPHPVPLDVMASLKGSMGFSASLRAVS